MSSSGIPTSPISRVSTFGFTTHPAPARAKRRGRPGNRPSIGVMSSAPNRIVRLSDESESAPDCPRLLSTDELVS